MEISEFFEKHSEVAVAFSGGVDSCVLLLFAKKYSKRVKAYFVKSQFQPEFELEDARTVSALLGAELEVLYTDILSDKTISANPADRCYHCKNRVFKSIISAARADGFGTVLDGTNASDDISDRPGFRALGELGVYSPLRLCSYTKGDIRRIARENGLPVFDKPSYACLATRVPTGTEITEELLDKTEGAENELRARGYRNFRVRYNGDGCRLELGKKEAEMLVSDRDAVFSVLSHYYKTITVDEKERADE
ncbi:MAG: ATP-dependent sacrificial sulfur transferase LarE [Eubacterium sp.]|nr:ATP-dependent sacrificial sulfur transferase LarE [Eubacterium sp.]